MPLTKSGEDVLSDLKGEYGDKKGTSVLYAMINKGKKGSQKWHAKGGFTKGIAGQSSRARSKGKVG